ncbi:hypothetical protein L6452_13713 [Arctium lappa]|uniref:Uncharacterized protein n=1 Tax=Arctium lappa TaxID=4217 RepID=A0ACB9CJ17_ARCLA|nr:hypothetical protein L6452_13713 [Arctium lappa]
MVWTNPNQAIEFWGKKFVHPLAPPPRVDFPVDQGNLAPPSFLISGTPIHPSFPPFPLIFFLFYHYPPHKKPCILRLHLLISLPRITISRI